MPLVRAEASNFKVDSLMKTDVGPCLRTLLDFILIPTAFLLPWSHFYVFSAGFRGIDPEVVKLFFVLLPIPVASFIALAIFNLSENPRCKRIMLSFLCGAALYFPIWLLFVIAVGGPGI
jgi:hypothetical protein